MKLELLTNATVVDDAIRFVSQKSKDNQKWSSHSNDRDDKESNEPNHDEDQLDEEQEKIGETTAATINQTF
jgi:hypothetical protein